MATNARILSPRAVLLHLGGLGRDAPADARTTGALERLFYGKSDEASYADARKSLLGAAAQGWVRAPGVLEGPAWTVTERGWKQHEQEQRDAARAGGPKRVAPPPLKPRRLSVEGEDGRLWPARAGRSRRGSL